MYGSQVARGGECNFGEIRPFKNEACREKREQERLEAERAATEYLRHRTADEPSPPPSQQVRPPGAEPHRRYDEQTLHKRVERLAWVGFPVAPLTPPSPSTRSPHSLDLGQLAQAAHGTAKKEPQSQRH